ncbi:MAG: hypothetical protein ACM3O3_12735 [Syntrophothermus sp.]
MRNTLYKTIRDVLSTDDSTMLFLVDLGVNGFKSAKKEFPDRVVNFGIMEDGMISILAGMSSEYINPIVYGINPFICGRGFEQLKLGFGYQQLQGNFITIGASYDFSTLGYSHYCPEDLGLIKMIPNFQFIAPGNGIEFKKLFNSTYNNGNPKYYRLTDYVNKTKVDTEFGKATVIKKGSKGLIVAISTMLDLVLQAVGHLDVTILYYNTLLPFDSKTLRENYNENIILCEPHFRGILSYEIIESLKGELVKLDFIGLPYEYMRNYGTKQQNDDFYGLNTEAIFKKVIDFFNIR